MLNIYFNKSRVEASTFIYFLVLKDQGSTVPQWQIFYRLLREWKNTDGVEKVTRNYIQKLQNIFDLYIFFNLRLDEPLLRQIKCNLWSHHYLHICWLNILLLDRQGTSLACIYFVFTKMAGNKICYILILKMAIADLLVTPDICDAIQRSCSQHSE